TPPALMSPPLLPYTTLFRSDDDLAAKAAGVAQHRRNLFPLNGQKDDIGVSNGVGRRRGGAGARAAPARQSLELREGMRVAESDRSEEQTSELQSRFDIVCRM